MRQTSSIVEKQWKSRLDILYHYCAADPGRFCQATSSPDIVTYSRGVLRATTPYWLRVSHRCSSQTGTLGATMLVALGVLSCMLMYRPPVVPELAVRASFRVVAVVPAHDVL